MTTMIVEDVVAIAFGLSGPEALALRVGAMVVSDLLKRPQIEKSADPHVLSSTPGRVRISVGGLKGSVRLARRIEGRVGQLEGVERVAANSLTGSVLVVFDPDRLGADEVTRAVRMAGMALRIAAPDTSFRLSSPEGAIA